ncbi:hypothetical protein BGX33_009367 [Mortierella sp. NVP41]|nr:hypothetical protein BGX33_009367 [Mortierella sp. NVP41]
MVKKQIATKSSGNFITNFIRSEITAPEKRAGNTSIAISVTVFGLAVTFLRSLGDMLGERKEVGGRKREGGTDPDPTNGYTYEPLSSPQGFDAKCCICTTCRDHPRSLFHAQGETWTRTLQEPNFYPRNRSNPLST